MKKNQDVCLVRTSGPLEIAAITTANLDQTMENLISRLGTANVLLSIKHAMVLRGTEAYYSDDIDFSRREYYWRVAWLLELVAMDQDLPAW